jgi:transposase
MLDAASRRHLAKLLAMGSSTHRGELANALRLADRIVREQHRLTWEQILLPDGEAKSGLVEQLQHQLNIATDACKQLQLENERLRHDLSRAAKAAANGAAGPDALLLGDHVRQAQWLLELHAEGETGLRAKEIEFVQTVARWRNDLTEKQAPWFADILGKVCPATGKTPP